jgi:hypothetical protein
MKRFHVLVGAICVFLFSSFAMAGDALRTIGNLDPSAAQPNSMAFGKSLDGWMGAYIRWLEDGADPATRVKNLAFLPIIGDSPFDVEVEPGTALVLPIATWLGFPGDDTLPDEWWGDRDHIFGDVYLDGELIAVPNEDYYVGPTDLVPNAFLFGIIEVDFYQALVVVIPPLAAGEHVIDLHAEFVDFGAAFDNVWNISVTPPSKNK